MEPLVKQRLENIGINIEAVKRRVELPQPEKLYKVIQLVCYGPSLKRTWKDIKKSKPIVTVSGAHDFLRQRDIIPNYHCDIDPREHKALHVTDPLPQTNYYLASCVHPELVKKVIDPVLWHTQQTEDENVFILSRENAHLVPGGSSAGLRAVELFIALGYRRFEIFGMDCSFVDRRWAGPHFGKTTSVQIEVKVACAKSGNMSRSFKTSPVLVMYAREFGACKDNHPDCTFNFHGDGLLQTLVKTEKWEKAA